MSRPVKEGMDYFPHDVNASNDRKVEALRSIYGNDGYAFYFIMLEQIYQEPDGELDVSDAETKEEIMQILSNKVSVTLERFKQMFSTAMKWGCFDRETYEEKGIITSNGIRKRMDVVIEKRQRMRDRYHQQREIVSDTETKQKPEVKHVGTTLETPQSKEKKSKEKKSSIYSSEFEEWYSSYPRPQAKADSFKNFEKVRKAKGLDFILQCTKNYKKYLSSLPPEKQEYAYSSNNFLGQKAYYLDFEQEKKKPKPSQPQQSDLWQPAEIPTEVEPLPPEALKRLGKQVNSN